MNKKKKDLAFLAARLERFEDFLEQLDDLDRDCKLSKNSKALLVKILDEWAKQKQKEIKKKKITGLIKGLSSFYK